MRLSDVVCAGWYCECSYFTAAMRQAGGMAATRPAANERRAKRVAALVNIVRLGV